MSGAGGGPPARARALARQRRARERALQRAAAMEPGDWQRRHSRTRPVEVVVARRLVDDARGGVAQVVVTRRQGERRLLDARLWERLSGAQQVAAERIYAAFCLITRGLGAHMSALGRVRVDGGTAPEGEGQQQLLVDYGRWSRACTAEGRDRAAVLAVLVEGRSCAALDRERRKRKGWATGELEAALALYCRLKGWR